MAMRERTPPAAPRINSINDSESHPALVRPSIEDAALILPTMKRNITYSGNTDVRPKVERKTIINLPSQNQDLDWMSDVNEFPLPPPPTDDSSNSSGSSSTDHIDHLFKQVQHLELPYTPGFELSHPSIDQTQLVLPNVADAELQEYSEDDSDQYTIFSDFKDNISLLSKDSIRVPPVNLVESLRLDLSGLDNEEPSMCKSELSTSNMLQHPFAKSSDGEFMRESMPVERWTTDDVVQWSNSVGLGHLSGKLHSNKVDGEKLLGLNTTLLDSLGLTDPVQRESLLAEVYGLKSQDDDQKSLIELLDSLSSSQSEVVRSVISVLHSPRPESLTVATPMDGVDGLQPAETVDTASSGSPLTSAAPSLSQSFGPERRSEPTSPEKKMSMPSIFTETHFPSSPFKRIIMNPKSPNRDKNMSLSKILNIKNNNHGEDVQPMNQAVLRVSSTEFGRGPSKCSILADASTTADDVIDAFITKLRLAEDRKCFRLILTHQGKEKVLDSEESFSAVDPSLSVFVSGQISIRRNICGTIKVVLDSGAHTFIDIAKTTSCIDVIIIAAERFGLHDDPYRCNLLTMKEGQKEISHDSVMHRLPYIIGKTSVYKLRTPSTKSSEVSSGNLNKTFLDKFFDLASASNQSDSEMKIECLKRLLEEKEKEVAQLRCQAEDMVMQQRVSANSPRRTLDYNDNTGDLRDQISSLRHTVSFQETLISGLQSAVDETQSLREEIKLLKSASVKQNIYSSDYVKSLQDQLLEKDELLKDLDDKIDNLSVVVKEKMNIQRRLDDALQKLAHKDQEHTRAMLEKDSVWDAKVKQHERTVRDNYHEISQLKEALLKFERGTQPQMEDLQQKLVERDVALLDCQAQLQQNIQEAAELLKKVDTLNQKYKLADSTSISLLEEVNVAKATSEQLRLAVKERDQTLERTKEESLKAIKAFQIEQKHLKQLCEEKDAALQDLSNQASSLMKEKLTLAEKCKSLISIRDSLLRQSQSGQEAEVQDLRSQIASLERVTQEKTSQVEAMKQDLRMASQDYEKVIGDLKQANHTLQSDLTSLKADKERLEQISKDNLRKFEQYMVNKDKMVKEVQISSEMRLKTLQTQMNSLEEELSLKSSKIKELLRSSSEPRRGAHVREETANYKLLLEKLISLVSFKDPSILRSFRESVSDTNLRNEVAVDEGWC